MSNGTDPTATCGSVSVSPLVIGTLLPVYFGDEPEALDRALSSIVNQRFTRPVLSRLYVGVDGPVPEPLEQVLAHWQASIFRIERLPRNMGLASVLNRLIHVLAEEALVFRMDADDHSMPERYQKQIDYLEEHLDIDIVGTDILEVDTLHRKTKRIAFGGNGDVRKELCRRVPVAHPTVCFQRHVLDRIGGYPDRRGNEDVAMWFRCAQEGFRFGNVREPLLKFTVNADFWKRRGWSKAFGEFRCYTQGIVQLHGLTWRLLYPVARLIMRILPASLSRTLYALRASDDVPQINVKQPIGRDQP